MPVEVVAAERLFDAEQAQPVESASRGGVVARRRRWRRPGPDQPVPRAAGRLRRPPPPTPGATFTLTRAYPVRRAGRCRRPVWSTERGRPRTAPGATRAPGRRRADRRTIDRPPAGGRPPPPSRVRPGQRMTVRGDGVGQPADADECARAVHRPGRAAGTRSLGQGGDRRVRVLGVVGGVGQRGTLSPPVDTDAVEAVGRRGGRGPVAGFGASRATCPTGATERQVDPQQFDAVEHAGDRRRPVPPGRGGARVIPCGRIIMDRAYGPRPPGLSAPSVPWRTGSVMAAHLPPARVAEWQTRWTQNPLSERVCGFDSRPGHHAPSTDPAVSRPSACGRPPPHRGPPTPRSSR